MPLFILKFPFEKYGGGSVVALTLEVTLATARDQSFVSWLHLLRKGADQFFETIVRVRRVTNEITLRHCRSVGGDVAISLANTQ